VPGNARAALSTIGKLRAKRGMVISALVVATSDFGDDLHADFSAGSPALNCQIVTARTDS
jgi:hypothetical protein